MQTIPAPVTQSAQTPARTQQATRPSVRIISPALAKANNGNWQTARRWVACLSANYDVLCTGDWNAQAEPVPDVLIALHARRSAAAVAAFAACAPRRPLILVLTGTDLYQDIRSNASAQASLRLATCLVLLQPQGLTELTPAMQAKSVVIYQSAPTLALAVRAARPRYFTVCMIGHLRAVKDPATFMRAAALIHAPRVRLLHVGAALDPDLGALAETTTQRAAVAGGASYQWLGALPHGRTRQRLRRSDLMVLSSVMEGGANVIIEAVTCGVPVLASDIAGNRGMLGDEYAGYFPVGDSVALAALIGRAATEPEFLATLQSQCARRAVLFAPARECTAVRNLVDNCVLDAYAIVPPSQGIP